MNHRAGKLRISSCLLLLTLVGTLWLRTGIDLQAFAGEMSGTASTDVASRIPVQILTETYAGRHAAHELSAPLEHDAIVLPLITSSRRFVPRKVHRQEVALASYSSDGPSGHYLWKAYPWRDDHEEFVKRWREATDETSRYELFRWCEERELYDCCEFLLRRALFDGQYRSTGENYRWYLAKWKEHGAHQRRSPFTFDLPVRGQWQVMEDKDRHHQQKHWSVWAWDLVMPRGYDLRRGADAVENYFTWRQPVFAVADGVVIAAVDRFPDHQTGVNAPAYEGNYLQLDCGGGIYAYYGHLRQNSLRINKGDRVRAGDELALVGNSGDSGVPHLHFTLMDGDGFSIRGRYRMDVWTTAGWHSYDGSDLEEGWHFRDRRK